MTRRLLLHVGHNKTGSSYLQALLAHNVDVLARHGIHYPLAANLMRARRNQPTTGNGTVLLPLFGDGDGDGNGHGAPDWPSDGETVLYSGEPLFASLVRPGGLERLVAAAAGFRIEILLFIRDPVSHAASAYNQAVKRANTTATIEEFFAAYSFPFLVDRLLRWSGALHGVTVTVRNYSRRERLAEPLHDWLGLPRGALVDEIPHRVNRSLTPGEAIVQSVLNEHLPRDLAFRLFALPIRDALPAIEPEPVYPARAAQGEMLDRMGRYMGSVNQKIDHEDRYEADPRDPVVHNRYGFTAEQLRFIGETLARLARDRPPRTGEGNVTDP